MEAEKCIDRQKCHIRYTEAASLKTKSVITEFLLEQSETTFTNYIKNTIFLGSTLFK